MRVNRMPALRCFLGIIVIFKTWCVGVGSLEKNRAGFADRQFIAFIVANANCAQQRPPDRTFMGQPFFRINRRETITFAAGIIFVNHRAPPFDHLVFNRYRARCCGVNGRGQGRQIIFCAHVFGEFQHAHEHGRYPLAVRDFVFLDQGQGGFRIEVFHDNACAAQLLHSHIVAQGCRMIERCRRQIAGFVVKLINKADQTE